MGAAAVRMSWDQVTADGNDARAALRPQRRRDAGRAAAPVVTSENGARDAERVQQGDHVGADGGLLARSRSGGVEEPRRSVPAQIADDDLAVIRAGLEVTHFQFAGPHPSHRFQPGQGSGRRGGRLCELMITSLARGPGRTGRAPARTAARSGGRVSCAGKPAGRR